MARRNLLVICWVLCSITAINSALTKSESPPSAHTEAIPASSADAAETVPGEDDELFFGDESIGSSPAWASAPKKRPYSSSEESLPESDTFSMGKVIRQFLHYLIVQFPLIVTIAGAVFLLALVAGLRNLSERTAKGIGGHLTAWLLAKENAEISRLEVMAKQINPKATKALMKATKTR